MKNTPEKPWYSPVVGEFLISDCAVLLDLPPATFSRDVLTLEKRLASEGESFLTKTLPAFGKVFDLALQERMPFVQTYFKKKRKGCVLPSFLYGLTRRVFNDDGQLLQHPCYLSIRLIRQLVYWYKKLEKGYSDESLQRAVIELKEVDAALPDDATLHHDQDLSRAAGLVRILFRKLDIRNLRYSHGPGAVAGGEDLAEKRASRIAYEELERVFRPIPTFFSLRDAAEDYRQITRRRRAKHGVSRIEFVEKDSSGPRVIGLEPAEYMWVQQGLKDRLYSYIEKQSIARGHINFTDQTVNRKKTAEWEKFATLDMSKASDRNSLALVKYLFKGTRIWPLLRASRSPAARLPSGEIVTFRKFAPMGSATCFPVQACVYWALAVSILVGQGYPFNLALRHVFVYGDDLVVPRDYAAAIMTGFERYALKMNTDKSCFSGKFRESCGLDAYDGFDVTPVRLRKGYPTRDTSSLVPLVKHANNLRERGYLAAAERFRLEALRNFPLLRELRVPFSSRPISILHWLSSHDTTRSRIQFGIRLVYGWITQALRLECPRSAERYYLRESLSRGGPVGLLPKSEEWLRVLDRKYASRLRKKWVVFYPTVTSDFDLQDDCLEFAKRTRTGHQSDRR